jgi:TIR domain
VAEELNHWLRAQGLRTFFDRSELRPGLPWVLALEEAINRSRAVAILFGKHSIGNTQQYERQFALVRQTHEAVFQVIPVLMPGCDPPTAGCGPRTDLSVAARSAERCDGVCRVVAPDRSERSGTDVAVLTIELGRDIRVRIAATAPVGTGDCGYQSFGAAMIGLPTGVGAEQLNRPFSSIVQPKTLPPRQSVETFKPERPSIRSSIPTLPGTSEA